MSGFSADIYTCNLLLFAPGEETPEQESCACHLMAERIQYINQKNSPSMKSVQSQQGLGQLIKKYIII